MNALTRIMTVSPTDNQLLEAVRLGMAMWTESPVYGSMDKDIDRMIEWAYHCRADASTFFNVAVDRTKHVCGFLIGHLAQYGFHSDKFAYDRLVYVTPTSRGTAVASVLLSAFEQWARDKGASRVLLGITTGIHTEQTERLYNKLGYTTVGRLTMRELH